MSPGEGTAVGEDRRLNGIDNGVQAAPTFLQPSSVRVPNGDERKEEVLHQDDLRKCEPVSRAFHGFADPADYKGSPLASLKADPGLWEGGDREPAAVRQAARAVGEAAAAGAAVAAGKKTYVSIERLETTTPAVAEVETGSSEPGKPCMGTAQVRPEVGKALMAWSGALHEAGRPMAALMPVQAVVMGIMIAHRRNVLAGCEEMAAVTPDATGDGGVAGNAVFGSMSRLDADFFAATGVEDAIFKSATLAFGKDSSPSGEGSDPSGVSSVLRGVPWLSVRDDGGLVWQPPAVVAEALDADLDDPTAWLAGVGGRTHSDVREVHPERHHRQQEGEEEERGRDGALGRAHPCLQQFEAYFAHRDEVDFAVALFKAGFTGSAFLVLSRTVASAALPEGVGALSVDGRIHRTSALRGSGSPPPLSLLEEESRPRERVWSKPLLIHRFEELAGFRIAGRWGSLKAVGLDATFDHIAKGAPRLHESAMGGKRVSNTDYKKRHSAASARISSTLNGSSGDEDHAVASRRSTPFEPVDEKSTLGMPWNGNTARAKRSAKGGKKNGRISVELDSIPSIAFSPRFEAARFLLDLLGLRGSAEESRRKRDGRRRLSLGRSIEVRGGAALLVAAALKGLQDEQETDGVGKRHRQKRGFQLDQLHKELHELCAFKLGAERVLESMRAAPGVVQGACDRYWWAFDASAVEDAIGVTEGGCEAEVDEFRGFLKRYVWVMRVLTKW